MRRSDCGEPHHARRLAQQARGLPPVGRRLGGTLHHLARVDGEELDEEIPDPFDFLPQRCTPAGAAFTVLEDLKVPQGFLTPSLAYMLSRAGHTVERQDFGVILFYDSSYVGTEETMVRVTTPLALSCLQHYLNASESGIQISLAR